MDQKNDELELVERHGKFLENLRANKITIPNEFTYEMGKLMRLAREEKGLSQAQLADKLNRRQATVSDIENGKIEMGVMTLLQIAVELNKPISYFIPEMTFFTSLHDLHNKWEEEALSIFRDLEYEGDSTLAVKFMKMLLEHNREEQNPDFGHPVE